MKANQVEATVRHLDYATHLLVPAVHRREQETLSQTGIETKPVIEISHLSPGTTEVDAMTLLGHDKDMMDKTVVLDHAMSHLLLDVITSRLDQVMTIGPHSTMDLRHQETSAW